jgi:cytochrome b6-f complex iron-sulfur subunit
MTNRIADGQTRRTFCTQAATLACGCAAGLALQACGGSSPTAPSGASLLPTVSGTRAASGVTVAVGAGSPLAAVGGAALVQSSAGVFLVSQTAQNSFVALTAICTHEACTITGFGSQTYLCPCHGSTFDVNGRRLSGPAPASLRQFPTQFADGVLTIAA